MPSQFFGLNIGASALSAFQTSVNTAANNVANVQTKGYTRQTANQPIRSVYIPDTAVSEPVWK
jgi:flagellar hook-associated protein 1 FlgK